MAAVRAGPWVHAVYVASVTGFLIAFNRWQPTFGASLLGLYLASWFGCSVFAVARRRKAVLLALLFSGVVLAGLAVISLFRIVFVFRHGGMDCASCEGSPMVFLWHWYMESAILLPGLVAALLLWCSARNRAGDA